MTTDERAVLGELFRFSIVGGIGFVVDAGMLYALLPFCGFYLARVGSILAAASVTWWLNRRFTFEARREMAAHHQWGRFLVVTGIGGLINFSVYSLLVASLPVVAALPIIGVVAGTLTALGWNFTMSRRHVF
ncbi:GtrA family protein [Gimibacter soli]|uniref:GtrA family protein n=1 Tax=Gimibacter soli TaxID=3024400 RepID=A0AAE9XTP3_9PROT|nr:GtrA family protein [Gimibacter soli]WCL55030.1 GtrA family protein [Gimibacter soli]